MDTPVDVEYLKVILGAPVTVVAAVLTFLIMFRCDVKALMARIAKVKFPGGEIETQLERAKEGLPPQGDVPQPIAREGAKIDAAPAQSNADKAQRDAISAERANAALWEYRYLNYFLARHTQEVLDWFADSPKRITLSLFNTWWLPRIPDPNERSAILGALIAHHLIAVTDGLVEVTPKGREYRQWRGPLPNTTPSQSIVSTG
jgi:hypothetical protein